MSLLSQQSQVNVDMAFFAPASGSGGGGSGTSTITDLYTNTIYIEDQKNAGQYPVRLRANSGGLEILNPIFESFNLTVSSITCSTINGAAPGGGGGSGPNPTVSTLTVAPTTYGIIFPNGASSFTMQYDTILNESNQPVSTITFENQTAGVNLGLDIAVGGLYIVGDGGSVGLASSAFINLAGTTLTVATPANGTVSISSITCSTINGAAPAVYNPTPAFSSITLNTLSQAINTATSTINFATIGTQGNQIVMSFATNTSAAIGMIAQNASDGIGFQCDNGYANISFGGGNGSLSNVSSINGAAPALTSGEVSDIAALFSTLFAANPTLSTIAI